MIFKRVFIAEKPALGKVIAEALGSAVQKGGYYECGNDAVTWCVGHILELTAPESHNPDYAKWKAEDLPLKLRPHKLQPKITMVKQFETIKNLIKQADTLVNAGDPDDEGQLLVDEVIEFCGASQPVKRLLINDLNVSAAKKALECMRDNAEFRGLYHKALARSVGDQLYGFNMTRAYSLAAQARGGSGVLSVGRVQTPVLGLIVARYHANKNHAANFYYSLKGNFDFSGTGIIAKFVSNDGDPVDDKGRITDQAFADALVASCAGKAVTIKSLSVDDKQQPAPLPFSLLDLQAAMSRKHGISAAKTLEITQNLRETYKAITYNRSDCNYLSSDQHLDAAKTLEMIINLFPKMGTMFIDKNQKGRAFNDANISAHTAIIPTTTKPNFSAMSSDEKKVYQAIVDRYVLQFMPDKTYKQANAVFDVIGHTFSATARQLVDSGWTALEGQNDEQDDEQGDEQGDDSESPYAGLSGLSGSGSCGRVLVSKEKTKPLPLYTESALLKDLQRVAKYVKDPRIKKLLQDKDADKKGESGGIGTPATRAAMLETLKKRNFYKEESKKLIPTKLGIDFIAALPDMATSPDMSALWHEQQTQIENGDLTVDEFLDALELFIADQIKSIDVSSITIEKKQAAGQLEKLDYVCPECKKDLINMARFIACRGCSLRVSKSLCDKALTDKQLATLLTTRVTPLIKGFTSKKGTKFNAILKLEAGGKVTFEFENKNG
ncbi:MAG: DNA topoisomerase [Aeromonas sp.]